MATKESQDENSPSVEQKGRAKVRRRRSSIRDEEAFIRETKQRLGDEAQLRDHALRHEDGAAEPCRQVRCRLHARWTVLEILNDVARYRPIAGPLREIRAELPAIAAKFERWTKLLEPFQERLPESLVPVLVENFESEARCQRLIHTIAFGDEVRQPAFDPCAQQAVHEFRELATFWLAICKHDYAEIAELVDEGDADRTRHRAAWRRAVEALASVGIAPGRVFRRLPASTAPAPPEGPPVADTAPASGLPGQSTGPAVSPKDRPG